jgi:hypothetical protein
MGRGAVSPGLLRCNHSARAHGHFGVVGPICQRLGASAALTTAARGVLRGVASSDLINHGGSRSEAPYLYRSHPSPTHFISFLVACPAASNPSALSLPPPSSSLPILFFHGSDSGAGSFRVTPVDGDPTVSRGVGERLPADAGRRWPVPGVDGPSSVGQGAEL